MSDEDQSRQAQIKIMRVEGTSIHRIEVKFLDHITASIRWDDKAEDARSEVLALLRDAQDIVRRAFIEIDVDNEREKGVDLDEEWAYYADEKLSEGEAPAEGEDEQ